MATKSASNRFDNSRGSKFNAGFKKINFQYVKGFNYHTLERHYRDHGKKYGSIDAYEQRAVQFGNTIDTKKIISFVDSTTGETYKFSKKTGEFAIIDREGYIVTFFEPKEGYQYFIKQYDKYLKTRGKK